MGEVKVVRATDADRDAFLKILSDAFTVGQLEKEEYDERVSKVIQALTVADMKPLIADINRATLPKPVSNLPVKKDRKTELATFGSKFNKTAVIVAVTTISVLTVIVSFLVWFFSNWNF